MISIFSQATYRYIVLSVRVFFLNVRNLTKSDVLNTSSYEDRQSETLNPEFLSCFIISFYTLDILKYYFDFREDVT